MFVVLKKTSENLPIEHWSYIVLVDRSKDKNHWWTVDPNKVFTFNSKIAANNKANSLKYGKFIVVPMERFSEYVGLEFFNRKGKYKGLSELITNHEQIWHDDDWYEGINDN